MNKSKILWTDSVWNPVTGCSKASEGCRNCYVEREWPRLAGNPKTSYFGRSFNEIKCHLERLDLPLRWAKPRKIFVNSMSDLFHDNVPDEFIDRVFATMSDASQHTFMILTKRPERMMRYLSPDNPRNTVRKVFDLTKREAGKFDCDLHWPLPNVWLGVSVENQAAADIRISLLLQAPATVRFISAEPLLGPLSLRWLSAWGGKALNSNLNRTNELDGLRCLNWVIVGGESGPKARQMHPDWVRGLRDECQAAGVPFFFKQWGEWFVPEDGEEACRVCGCTWNNACEGGCYWIEPGLCNNCVGKTVPEFRAVKYQRVGRKKAGRMLDGRTWDQIPEAQY